MSEALVKEYWCRTYLETMSHIDLWIILVEISDFIGTRLLVLPRQRVKYNYGICGDNQPCGKDTEIKFNSHASFVDPPVSRSSATS